MPVNTGNLSPFKKDIYDKFMMFLEFDEFLREEILPAIVPIPQIIFFKVLADILLADT